MNSNLDLFKGLLEMMNTRGYDTSYYNLSPEITSEHFNNVVIPWMTANPSPVGKFLIEKGKITPRYMLSSAFNHLTRPNDRCVIYFTELGASKTVPLSETCIFGELYLQERNNPLNGGVTTGIIVSSVKMSPNAQKRLTEFKNVDPNIFLQHFLDIDLLYNPTKSIWGSIPDILTLEESKKFLIENGLTKNQLPLTDISKPLCKYYGVRPDQIIKYERHTFIPDVPLQNEIHYRLATERFT
jgi:DNA-directed RNA polymerase subunit H (RpoH/RPB5)